MIGEDLPKLEHFTRSIIEGICFGILENFLALHQFTEAAIIVSCSGGMSKSNEVCKILANILNKELKVPQVRDSSFIGNAINALIGLERYPDYKSIIDDLLKFDKYNPDPSISKEYKSIFSQWKNLKNKIDNL
jgi:sugar (pentulose or hexulose) kinase